VHKVEAVVVHRQQTHPHCSAAVGVHPVAQVAEVGEFSQEKTEREEAVENQERSELESSQLA